MDLSKNRLSALPGEFSNLSSLVTIDISENELEVFPEVLQRVPNLSLIILKSNKILNVCTSNYDNMQCLETLNLENNPLSEETKCLLQSVVRFRIVV